jgi:hypothetical protein
MRMSIGSRVRHLVLAVLTLSATGCALTYQYDGKTYGTRHEAISAARNHLDSTLLQIVPVQAPVGGLATVIIPSRSRTIARAIVRTGRPSSMQDEAADYVSETLFLSWANHIDALRRARVFDEVTVALSDDPAETAATSGGDVIIWLDLVSPETAQWYGMRSGWGAPVALPLDLGTPPGAARLQKWVQLVAVALPETQPSNKEKRRTQT